jgi:hypothetical protein
MLAIVKDKSKNNKNMKISLGNFRDWLYDNYNIYNNFKPSNPLFLNDTFIKNNFSSCIKELFIIEKDGRNKYIIGILGEEKKRKQKMNLNQLEEQKIFRVNIENLSEDEVLALADIEPYMQQSEDNGDVFYKRDQLLQTTFGQLNNLYATMRYVNIDYLLIYNKKR